jgi:hypothetical protein
VCIDCPKHCRSDLAKVLNVVREELVVMTKKCGTITEELVVMTKKCGTMTDIIDSALAKDLGTVCIS